MIPSDLMVVYCYHPLKQAGRQAAVANQMININYIVMFYDLLYKKKPKI